MSGSPYPLTRFAATVALSAVLGPLHACCPGGPDGPVGPSQTPAAEAGVGEIWIVPSCDLQGRLDGEIEAALERGVVPVHGGEAYRWAFECDGALLQATVETVGPTADGDPILWLGATGNPPRLVPIRLDVGAGQGDLERLLADPQRPEPQVIAIDPSTGVVWRI